MQFGRRQALGIAGIALAIGGGVAWFYGQNLLGVLGWAAAFILMLRLNKKKKRK